ncbi:MAG: DUF5777 family beta-barrel protein [Bacteroidota bacterium]|nr:DUF5777 family beta-barrel protein [Bacteroidota bacterium]
MIRLVLSICLLLLTGAATNHAAAQMARKRAANQPADELFWSPSITILPSTTTLRRGNLDFVIQHAFGPVSSGIRNLFGLDAAANIRFGLDYGLTDAIMIGVGRSRFNKVVDLRVKARVLRQSGWQIAGLYAAGVETPEDGRDLADRMSYHASALIGKRLSERMVVQLAPGLSRFVYAPDELRPATNELLISQNNHWSVGAAGRYEMQDNVSLTAEYLAVLGERTDGTHDVLSVGVDLETGGHVFQMFFTSTQWITPQHAIAWSRSPVSDLDFGWGFNVHRVFGTGR